MVFSTPQWVSGQFWCGFVVSIHKPGSATLDGFKLHAWGFQHWLNQGLVTLCFDSFMISSKVPLHESQSIIYLWTVFGTCACSRRASLCLGPQQGFDIIGRQIDSQIYMRANVLVIAFCFIVILMTSHLLELTNMNPQFVNVSLHLACESSSVLIFRQRRLSSVKSLDVEVVLREIIDVQQ